MEKDILLMGACQVFVLLKLRHENKLAAGIQVLKPEFDANKIKLLAEDRIHMWDLRGRFDTKRHENLYDRLEDSTLYKHLYLIVSIEVAEDQFVEKARAENRRSKHHKLAADIKLWDNHGWYHLYSHNWTPQQAMNWKENRHSALIQVMKDFPTLKFVIFRSQHLKWWKTQGFPIDRVIFWPIQWLGESNQSEAGDPWNEKEFMERMEEMRKQGGFGFHNFPTEDSYNELYDLIIRDADGIQF